MFPITNAAFLTGEKLGDVRVSIVNLDAMFPVAQGQRLHGL
jgi:hypothetical protein